MARFKDDDFVDISSSAAIEKVYHKNPSGGGKKSSKKRRKGLAIRVTVLTFSIIFLIAGAAALFADTYLKSIIGKFTTGVEYDDYGINKTIDQSNNSSGSIRYAEGSKLLDNDNVVNILLFGQDYRASEDDNGRSDSMILMSLDTIHKKIKLTSFQRDTYVVIPAHGNSDLCYSKINAAYTLGGEGLSIATVEANFGVRIDQFATVDFKSFREIINVLGGVDLELNEEEVQYINAQIDVNGQIDRTSFLEYDPNKTVYHLDGYQALWYSRDRGADSLGGNPEYSFSGDDWDRTQRQRKLIQTIISSLHDASLGELVEIVNRIGPLISTSMSSDQIMTLVSYLPTIIKYKIEDITVPTTGNWSYGRTSDGQSIIAIDDWNQVRYDVAEFIYEDV